MPVRQPMNIEMQQVRGVKKSRRDPARALALLGKIRAEFAKDGRFKGMTEEQILRKARQTREEVWNELKNAAGSRR